MKLRNKEMQFVFFEMENEFAIFLGDVVILWCLITKTKNKRKATTGKPALCLVFFFLFFVAVLCDTKTPIFHSIFVFFDYSVHLSATTIVGSIFSLIQKTLFIF